MIKTIKGYGSQYSASTCGKIISHGNDKSRKEKILKTHTNKKTAHQKVQLYSDGRSVKRFVHRLVAETFLDNPLKLPCVNHKDNDPTNNNVENLEWCTQQENIKHYFDNFFVRKENNPINLEMHLARFLRKTKLTRDELKELL